MSFICQSQTVMRNTVKAKKTSTSSVSTPSIGCTIDEFMMRNDRTMEEELGEIKLEKHRNVHEVSHSLLVNLEAPAVAVNRRDDKYVQRKLT